MAATSIDQIVSLAKQRGFVFQASEIYGGLGSCWDYGPLGVALKKNIKDAWWRTMVEMRRDVVGLDSAILQHPKVWESSGHLANFSDPLVDCRTCKARFRADDLEGAVCPHRNNAPINDDCKAAFTEPREFNLMFQTHMGPVQDEGSVAYLRPETAQGIFTNFLNVKTALNMKVPFGIAQIGKSFRNEITPGNFIFRTREFEQMEMEYFIHPEGWEEHYDYWRNQRMQWYVDLGLSTDNLRFREHDKLAHYAKATADVEYKLPIGWSELEGIACRHKDLGWHADGSGRTIEYLDPQTNERYQPWVIEPAAGVDRAMLAFMVDAYDEEDVDGDVRKVMRLHPRLAPTKVAVFPLVKKDGLPEVAQQIEDTLRARGITTFYDQNRAIGKRYRRQDEVGTPWCITIDGETKEAGTVTLRDRDSMAQERVPAAELPDLIAGKLAT